MAIVRSLDPVALRADFAIFEREFRGRRLAYLDSAATSLKPRVVADAMSGYLNRYSANVHRGIYEIGEEATAAYEGARSTIASFIGANDAREVIMVRNATEAINLVAYAWGRKNIGRADTIVTTEMEHHSNLIPWQMLAQEKDADIEFVPFDEEGRLIQDSFDVLLRTKPKLVAFTAVSNGIGTINPVADMVARAHEAGALVLVDAAQAVPHEPVNVQELGLRLPRLLGPQGARPARLRRALGAARDPRADAAVHGRRRDDPRGPPAPHDVQRGALQVRGRHARRQCRDRPRRPGSTTCPAIGMEHVRAHERELVDYALEVLPREVPSIRIHGPLSASDRAGVITFNLADAHPHDVATLLDREAIAVRAGHHCTMPLHQRLGEEASARASFYIYTDREDIDRLAEALNKVERLFARNQ